MDLAADAHSQRIQELDGWRAASVMLVIGYHILGLQHARLVSWSPLLTQFAFNTGQLGVKIFFVISGFVICRLLIREEAQTGSVSLKGFYFRRIFRIIPPFYTYLGAISLLTALGLIHESWQAILESGLFSFDLSFTPHSWFVGHTWSLAIEEQFYLIFPGLWILMRKSRRAHAALGIFLLIAAWNLSDVLTRWDALTSGNTRAGFACISCGVLMAIHEDGARRIAKIIPAAIVALAGLVVVVHPVVPGGWLEAMYESLIVPPAICLVLCFSLERGPWLRAILRSRPMQAIGLTSYGIYLWQQLFTAPKSYWSATGEHMYFSQAGQIITVLLPLLFLIVPFSYFLIEKPAMRFGKLMSRRIGVSKALANAGVGSP